MQIQFDPHPHAWRHPKWNRIQLRYFQAGCKIRREKRLEDWVLTNGFGKIHILKDNSIFDEFAQSHGIELTSPDCADAVIVTHQQFSRLDTRTMLRKLQDLIAVCPRIYLCINKWYLNGNQSCFDDSLPEAYDVAMVTWLAKNLPNTMVTNLSEIIPEDGSWFTWVVPSSEFLICRK